MVLGRKRLKSELIEQVIKSVETRWEGAQGDAAARFARTFYAHVAPEDILGESVDSLAGAALAVWEFAQERPAGSPKLRVYDPREENDGWQSSHTILEIVNDDMPFLVDSTTLAIYHTNSFHGRLSHLIGDWV